MTASIPPCWDVRLRLGFRDAEGHLDEMDCKHLWIHVSVTGQKPLLRPHGHSDIKRRAQRITYIYMYIYIYAHILMKLGPSSTMGLLFLSLRVRIHSGHSGVVAYIAHGKSRVMVVF